MYTAASHILDASDLYLTHICTYISSIYPIERYEIHVKCDRHICFRLNTIHHFINSFEVWEARDYHFLTNYQILMCYKCRWYDVAVIAGTTESLLWHHYQ